MLAPSVIKCREPNAMLLSELPRASFRWFRNPQGSADLWGSIARLTYAAIFKHFQRCRKDAFLRAGCSKTCSIH